MTNSVQRSAEKLSSLSGSYSEHQRVVFNPCSILVSGSRPLIQSLHSTMLQCILIDAKMDVSDVMMMHPSLRRRLCARSWVCACSCVVHQAQCTVHTLLCCGKHNPVNKETWCFNTIQKVTTQYEQTWAIDSTCRSTEYMYSTDFLRQILQQLCVVPQHEDEQLHVTWMML